MCKRHRELSLPSTPDLTGTALAPSQHQAHRAAAKLLILDLLGNVSDGAHGYSVQIEISFLESFVNEFSHKNRFCSSCRIKGNLDDVGVH